MTERSNKLSSILVIEDDAGDFGLVKAYLRETGLCAIGDAAGLNWAPTLAEGIAMAQQTSPDIVLLDLSLPDSSGLATLQILRAALPQAPILVLTGNDEKSLALAALESGAQDYLVKGQFDADALGRAIRHAQVRSRITQERYFIQAALDSLPGLFYLFDEAGHLLRWNRNFEKVSGYNATEIAAMSPQEFFGETDRASVSQAITQSFATGEAVVEADFVAKDRTVTPFLFSGKRFLLDQKLCLMGLGIDITQSKAASARIEWLSHFDMLTGLANQSLLRDRFQHAISMAQRSGRTLTLMTLDLDHFKNINDTLGRHIGDAMLVEVARRIQAVVHEEDTVSRQGGDEFVMLLPTTDAAGAGHMASRLLAVIAETYQIDAQELVTTPSIGIAMYPADGADFETLAKNADVAMYRAKRDGRNCYRFFAAEMQTQSTQTLHIENALRRALERGQLSLHYQPQMALCNTSIVGAEALLRWQHPEFGWVSPAEFIPIAEASGQIVQIGEWVLRTAVRQMKTWLDLGLVDGAKPFLMAVNLSVVQFRHPHLIEQVMQILQEEQLAPEHLELELTEGVALSDPLGVIAVMDALHARGIRMSIDDFGTGYSSLSYLKRFKVYKLKIDQSFVRDLTDDPEDKAIVSAIISMAGSLGLQTIAEGVETEGQLAFLRDSGCNEVQGYYYSKPLPAQAFEAFLRQMRDGSLP
jgi:diguanylate cyclase (GGDEF)-like protein/PAS domain S-box-containing protein